jgi:hypothetical protein
LHRFLPGLKAEVSTEVSDDAHIAMRVVFDVCLNPQCLWLSLPWAFKSWNQWPEVKGRCPRCGGMIAISPDLALKEHWERVCALLSRPCL